jgi:chromosome partitioning protein
MTMFDGRTNLARVVKEVKQHFPQEIFQTIIPRNVRLSEAPSFGEDIWLCPDSVGCLPGPSEDF